MSAPSHHLTALWFVMPSRSEERLRLLLDAGADAEAKDNVAEWVRGKEF